MPSLRAWRGVFSLNGADAAETPDYAEISRNDIALMSCLRNYTQSGPYCNGIGFTITQVNLTSISASTRHVTGTFKLFMHLI